MIFMGTRGCKGLRGEGWAPRIPRRSKAGSRSPESREAPPGPTVPGEPSTARTPSPTLGEAVECLLARVK